MLLRRVNPIETIANKIFECINKYSSPLFFTSYSTSYISGVPNFNNKVYGHYIDQILNVRFLEESPELFFDYLEKLHTWVELKPNYIHQILGNTQSRVVTECFDSLHVKAGNSSVIELYGNLNKILCNYCNFEIETCEFLNNNHYFKKSYLCPSCNTILQPSIILQGQPLKNFNTAINAIHYSDAFIILGNKPIYYPVSRLITKANDNKCKVLYISI